MVVLFKPAIFLTLEVASLALSAAINNDVLQSREDAVPAQVTPNCESLRVCHAFGRAQISKQATSITEFNTAILAGTS